MFLKDLKYKKMLVNDCHLVIKKILIFVKDTKILGLSKKNN